MKDMEEEPMDKQGTSQEQDLRSEVSLLAGRMRAATTMLGGLLENIPSSLDPEAVENFTARAWVLLESLEGYIKALEDVGKEG